MTEKKIEKNNLTISINVLYAKNKKIYSAYVSKHNSKHEKQVILFMILKREGQHYFEVKKLSELLRRITSKNNCHFYGLNCLHFLEQKTNLNYIKKVCENNNSCNILTYF